jgi:hypothetical protein
MDNDVVDTGQIIHAPLHESRIFGIQPFYDPRPKAPESDEHRRQQQYGGRNSFRHN